MRLLGCLSQTSLVFIICSVSHRTARSQHPPVEGLDISQRLSFLFTQFLLTFRILEKSLNRILQGKTSRKCCSSAWPSARTQTFYQLVTHAVTENPFLSVRGPDFWLICATYKRWDFRTWRKAPATVLDVSHNPILFSQLNEVGISLMLWKTHANTHRVSRPDEVYEARRFGIQTAICLACYPTPCDLSSIKYFSENKPKDITEKSIAIFLKNTGVISSINFVHTLFHIREIPKYLSQSIQVRFPNTNKVAELSRRMGNRLW